MAKSTTRQLVEIADIVDEIILLKNGSLRTVIEVTSINFELRSGDEQTAILQNFQRFLNSLDFPLQIVVNSRRLNINEYIKLLEDTANNLQNELIKIQANEYSNFIKELSDLANIMSKKFYIVIPFYAYENPSKTGVIDSFKSLIGKSSSKTRKIDEKTMETYKAQMLQRVELVFDGLVGLGLRATVPKGDELTNLFYQLYNPEVKASPIESETIKTQN